jgi:hypothetical protein
LLCGNGDERSSPSIKQNIPVGSREEAIHIMPNPVYDRLVIYSDFGTIENVSIYDLAGSLILEPQIMIGKICNIDLSSLTQGIWGLLFSILFDGSVMESFVYPIYGFSRKLTRAYTPST